MGKKILIVDDDPDYATIIQHQLLAVGHKLTFVDNGEDALSAAAEEQPDVILLDVLMPKLNGFQVLKMLKANEKTKSIPVIILTTLDYDENRFGSLKGYWAAYLVKSTDQDTLRQKIDEVKPSS